MLSTLLLALTTAATAGSGPWVIGTGQSSLYMGAETQRLTQLALSTGSYATEDVVDVGSGLSTIGAQAIVTYGLLPRLEIEGLLPVYRVRANRTDAELCDALGLDACKATSGVGVMRIRAKGMVLDELYGPPFSLAIGPELRLGELTAPERARLTNLGEGTTDVGAFVSIGRTGLLGGSGAWSAFAEGGWRYRFPNTELEPDLPVPGSEFFSDIEAFFGPNLTWAVGPSVTAYIRPDGVDFEEVDMADQDRFSALRVLAIQAGGKVLVRSGSRVTLSAGALRTVYAENNPSDVLSISVGLTIQDVFGKDAAIIGF
jgi:hypothetical protein